MQVDKFKISVLFLVIFAFVLIALNQDYLTPLIEVGTNEPTNIPPAEPIQTPPIINPDGTKTYTVDLSWHTEMTFEIGGSHFSLSKYIAFTFGTILLKILMEFVEQLTEHIDIAMLIVTFLAFIHIRKGHS